MAESMRLRFTEARLRDQLAAPAGKRLRLQDEVQPGLFLRVTDSGAKTFKLRRKMNGRDIEMTLGSWPKLSLEAARKQATLQLAEIASGVDVQAKRKAMREESTLGDLFDDYLTLHAKPRKRTWEEDVRRFNCHLLVWKNRRISSITPSEVQAWHGRVGKDNGQIAANRSHALLRKMFNFARIRGFDGQNPAVGVQRFQERSRDRFMDADELRFFFAALKAEPERTARDFFLLALLTGARRGNVLAMRWADLDLHRGVWRIPGEKSKSGEPLVVILAPPVVELLKERRALQERADQKARAEQKGVEPKPRKDRPWVLPSEASASGHFVEPKVAWDRILARAELVRLANDIAMHEGRVVGLDELIDEVETQADRLRVQAFSRRLPKGTDPVAVVMERLREKATKLEIDVTRARMADLRIHDLRRTLGSWQAANGASLSVIGRSLGHRQVQTTAIYARLSLDPIRESVERANTAMLAVVGLPGTGLPRVTAQRVETSEPGAAPT